MEEHFDKLTECKGLLRKLILKTGKKGKGVPRQSQVAQGVSVV
jgi:hypothetical protein